MKITFEEVFKNAYVIYNMSNQRVGFIGLKNTTTMLNIDIDTSYFTTIKQYLLDKFLEHVGRDYIYIAMQSDTHFDYYSQFGFKRCKNNGCKLKYSIISTD